MKILNEIQSFLRLAGVRRQDDNKFISIYTIFLRIFVLMDIVGSLVFVKIAVLPVYLKIFTLAITNEMASVFICSILFNSKREQIDELIEKLQCLILSRQSLNF